MGYTTMEVSVCPYRSELCTVTARDKKQMRIMTTAIGAARADKLSNKTLRRKLRSTVLPSG
jgi:ribosomal protein S3AE